MAGVSSGAAVGACAAMAVLYVGMLYFPCLVLRLPPARTVNEHFLRRFACSIVASVLASAVCFWLLPVRISLHLVGALVNVLFISAENLNVCSV
jgi:prenyl protein peptidase